MKRVLAILSLICMLAIGSTASADAATTGSLKFTGDVKEIIPHATEITFGEYPQKEIVDRSRDSGVYGKAWEVQGDYLVDQGLYSLLSSATFDDNDVTEIDGVKYKRMLQSQAEYSVIDSANHYDWPDGETYHYFRFDPIKWRVLSKENNGALLLAEKALDVKQYNVEWKDVTWENSQMRSWINTDFTATAFNEEEIAAIQNSQLTNAANSYYKTEGGNNTQDKVFLLAESDAFGTKASQYGFESSYNKEDAVRMAKCSTYAKARGAIVDSGDYAGNCNWFLRTPGEGQDMVECVNGNGKVSRDGVVVDENRYAVRPALILDTTITDVYKMETDNSKIAEITSFLLEKTSYDFDGTERKPRVSIKNLLEGSDFKVSYKNNKEPGTATVTVTGIGSWSGTMTRSFKINFTSETTGEITRDVKYNCYYYGSYPQTEIVSEAAQCGTYGKKNVKEKGYIVSSTLYNKLEKAKWNSNNDTTINGVKYKRLKKSQVNFSFPKATSQNAKNYYSWDIYNDYHYFRYDPIKWRRLYKNGNDAFLLADKFLDRQSYTSKPYKDPWIDNSVRDWLNGNFYKTAFTKSEQAFIKTTSLKNEGEADDPEAPAPATKDKVFLLTRSDIQKTANAVKYGFMYDGEYWSVAGGNRYLYSSTYSAAKGTPLASNNLPLRSGDTDYYNIVPVMHLNLANNTLIKSAGTTDVIYTMKYSDMKGVGEIEPLYAGNSSPEVYLEGLSKDVDYSVSYENNEKTGVATVTITGMGKYTGKITKTYAVVDSIDISGKTMSLSSERVMYQGSACKPAVKISGLTEGRNYKVTYRNNTSVGTATAVAIGINGWKGSITKNFRIISGKDISQKTASLSYYKTMYTEKYRKPAVKIAGLEEGTDFTVKYYNNFYVGKAKAVITGKGSYYGTITKTFIIRMPGTSFSSISTTKNGCELKWVIPEVCPWETGYIIKISRYSTMEKAKTYKVLRIPGRKQSKKISDLASGRKYYVQIRLYTKRLGVYYYSDWSAKKTFTTK